MLRKRREEGLALLLVLWVIALLSVLAFSLAHGVDTQAKIDRNEYDGARARTLADTGVSLAILGVLDRGPDGPWRLDGTARELAYGDGTIRVRVQNEAGKIDLNQADARTFANLFGTVGIDAETPESLAAAIVDWRNRRRLRWSQQLAANAVSIGDVQPFLALEELHEVPGVTPEIYDRVSPFLTIYSGSARVDPLTAPREVLLSLPGADAREVATYVSTRAEVGPNPAMLPALDGVGTYLSGGSAAHVSISSEGRIPPRARFVRNAVVSLLEAGAERFRFVTWQQGRGADE